MRPPSALNEKFGIELRKARLHAGLSQEELAFRADLHRTYISLLERGVKSPTLETFFKICAALGEDPVAFVSRLGQIDEP